LPKIGWEERDEDVPEPQDPSWIASLIAAQEATHYYDRSLDPDPATNKPDRRPKWATDGSMIKTADIEAFHFYRLA